MHGENLKIMYVHFTKVYSFGVR